MIRTIDLHFLGRRQSIAAYLIGTSATGYALVESGPFSTHETLLAQLATWGVAPAEVTAVLLTHIHFDHAGAAWWWAARGARIYVHPRGHKHLANPTRLYNSARRIYGERMEELWGDMRGIDAERLVAVPDREELTINGQRWTAHHTPGHASHHIAWQLGADVFTGDVGGVSVNGGPVVPPCPPPDIDHAAWAASIERLRSLGAATFYLTHYGPTPATPGHLDQLAQRLASYREWIQPHAAAGTPVEKLIPQFEAFAREELRRAGVGEADLARYAVANPPAMSVAGLLRAEG